MSEETINTSSHSFSCALERLNLDIELSYFDEEKHLIEREKQYCCSNLTSHGIFVVRETQDGWWRESIDFKGELSKQIDKLRKDPSVSIGFINTARFNDNGGWYDPNG